VVSTLPSTAPSPTRPITSATAPCAWPFTPSNPATIALTVLADIASAPFVFSPKQAAPLLQILISCVQCLICCRVFRLHFLSVHIRCEFVVDRSGSHVNVIASHSHATNATCHEYIRRDRRRCIVGCGVDLIRTRRARCRVPRRFQLSHPPPTRRWASSRRNPPASDESERGLPTRVIKFGIRELE
jgi:hypothetical protein